MAGYVRAWEGTDLAHDFGRLTAPTLIITGEPHLDRVVPVRSSLEYLDLIPGARHAELRGTGHVGLITMPDRFAEVVDEFIGSATGRASAGRREAPTRHAS
jgi:pimeloyl-ACP methyl ester carboxylesterase